MATTRRIKVGDRVLRLYGHPLTGLVLEIYGPKGHQSAMVRLPVLGPDGETLEEYDVSIPLDSLRPIEAEAA